MSLQQLLILIGYVLAFAACGVAWQHRKVFIAIFDRYVARTPGSDDANPGSGTSSDGPVLTEQNQENQEPVRNFERALAYLSQHNLTPDEAIDILSVLHLEDGYLLSANKIRDAVGGADATVKARVASHRPKPVPVRTQGHMERPANGW